MSRPEEYTEETFSAICSRLADGESLAGICREETMPDKSTFYRWLQKRHELRDRYAKAKEDGCDALFEELMDIADDGSNDWMETNDPDNPGWRFNGEHYQRSRLRVDTRKWALSKLKPKRYGERIELVNQVEQLADAVAEILMHYVPEENRKECADKLGKLINA